MTKYKSWKHEERTIAKAFNSQRALGLGSDEKSDIISDVFAVDAKVRKNFSLRWYDDLKRYADKSKKIPVLVLRKPGRKRRLVVIDFDYFNSLCRGAGIDADQGGGSDGN